MKEAAVGRHRSPRATRPYRKQNTKIKKRAKKEKVDIYGFLRGNT